MMGRVGEVRFEGTAGGKVQMRKPRPKSWTVARKAKFIEHLTVSCNVAASCRKVGMREPGAYRHRALDASFRAAWTAAVAEAVERMQMMLMERALHGKIVERRYKDGTVTKTVEHSDALALTLIKAHRGSAAAHFADADEDGDDDEAQALRLRIMHKLELIARKQETAERKAAALPAPAGDALVENVASENGPDAERAPEVDDAAFG